MFVKAGRRQQPRNLEAAMGMQEAMTIAAEVDPATWRRRRMLVDEYKMVHDQWPALEGYRVVMRWVTVSQYYRAPTTIQSYLRTLLSLVEDRVAKHPMLQSFLRGLAVLFGQHAMNNDITMESYTRKEIVDMMMRMPRWARVRMDAEWGCAARDADLTYVWPADVTILDTERQVEVRFRFLKNNLKGEHDTWKRYAPIVWEDAVAYIQGRQREQPDEPVFPHSYEQFLETIRRAGGTMATRAIRRGAAKEVAANSDPEGVRTLLAHKGVMMQRRYLGGLTAAEKENFERMAADRARSYTTSTSPPTQASSTTISAPGPQPGLALVNRQQLAPPEVQEADEAAFRRALAAVGAIPFLTHRG
jgi:hypothetical protein